MFHPDFVIVRHVTFEFLRSGLAGRQGEWGDRGELIYPADIKGYRGNVGDKGFPGYEGPIGPIGPAGPSGLDGLIGIKGEKVRISILTSSFLRYLHISHRLQIGL